MVDSHEILGPSGSAETGELTKALAKAQAEMGKVSHDSSNPHFRSKFSSLAQCVEELKGPLTKNGLAIPDFRPGMVAGEWVCVGTLRHATSGQWISGIAPLLMQKRDMQQFGAAMTYAKRTLLMALTGAVSGEHDDDGQSVSVVSATKSSQRAAPKESPARQAANAMSYEAMASKAIEEAESKEKAEKALATVELRAREGSVKWEVYTCCKKVFTKNWEGNK